MTTQPYLMVICDPDMHASAAIERAVRLARGMKAAIGLYLFDDRGTVIQRGIFNAELSDRALAAYHHEREQWLESQAAGLRAEGFQVETHCDWGRPTHERIVAAAAERQPAFVIKDVHSDNALKRLLFTSEDWQILRRCPAPVMLVKPHRRELPAKIMAAVDPLRLRDEPAGLDDDVIGAARRIADAAAAELHIAHAYHAVPVSFEPFGGHLASQYASHLQDIRQQHEKALNQLAERHQIPGQRVHLCDGDPDRAIANLVEEEGFDLVVLGTIRRTGLERVTMGSTAERILDRLHADVLAIKPQGFLADLRRELGAKSEADVPRALEHTAGPTPHDHALTRGESASEERATQ